MKRPSCITALATFLISISCFQISLAQDQVLTAEDAVKLALAANYGIQVSTIDTQIAHLNNTKGNAGMLPTVNFVANENFTLSAFQQQLANGTEFVAAGAPFNNANAGVQLAWTLFDGHKMQVTKNRLEQTEALSLSNLQEVSQSTAANVLVGYFDIVRGKMQERAITEIIQLNEERLRIANARQAAGFAAQTDALQARIDLNQRKADLLVQQTATAAAKRSLNLLMVRPPETAFEVIETIESSYTPDRSALTTKILAQNPALASLKISAQIAALMVDENRALGKARLVGLGQVNASRADNGAGFTLNNTQAGITVGASLVIPLYTGGNVKRQVETSKLAAQQAQIRILDQQSTLGTELENQIAALSVQQQILTLEDQNVKDARENLSVSTERFRVGTTNGLEPQTAQNSLEQALARRNLVLYNLKIAELQLKLLAGEL